tara:strand:- start:7 stop:405 length:399 start_codon:yes stop_codon:yes gene_type:complete
MTKQSTKDFFKEYGANKMNPKRIHSMAFGRAFWLDEDEEFCSAPWRQDGTVDMEQQDYVGEWTDLEGVSLHKLFIIHRNLVLGKGTNQVEVGQHLSAMVDANNIDEIQDILKLSPEEVTKTQITLGIKGNML